MWNSFEFWEVFYATIIVCYLTSPVLPVSLINTAVRKALSIFRPTSIHCTSNTQIKFKPAVRLWYNEGNEKNTAV